MVSGELLLNLALMIVGLASAAALVTPVLAKRTAEGIALTTPALTLIASIAWCVYGTSKGNVIQVVANGVEFIVAALIIGVAFRSGAMNTFKTVACFAAAAAATIVAMHVAGVAGVGIVAAVATAASRVPQTIAVLRTPGGAGVSVLGNGMGAFLSVGWVAYGVLRGDITVIASSLWCAAQSCIIAGRTDQARKDEIIIFLEDHRTDVHEALDVFEYEAAFAAAS